MASWLVGLALGLAPGAARAVRSQVAVRSGALFDELQAWDGTLLPRRRVVQQLQLGLYDLAGDGRGQLRLVGALRVDAEFGLDEAEAAILPARAARDFAVPYLFLQGQQLWHGRLDLTVGRQFRLDEAEFLLFDGARVLLRGPLHLGVEAFGGYLVRQELSPAGLEDLAPDGTPLGEESSPTYGAGLLLHGLAAWHGQLSMRQQREGEGLARSVAAASGAVQPWPSLVLDGRYARDLLHRRDEERALALTLQRVTRGRLTGRFTDQLPRLDAGSVFSVFRLEPQRSWSLDGELELPRWTVGLGGNLRRSLGAEPGLASSPGRPTLPLGPLPGEPAGDQALGLDASCRWAAATDWQLQGSGSWRSGGDGARRTLTFGGSWQPLARFEALLEGQARWVQLRDAQPGARRGGDVYALDLSASALLWERARLQLVVEQAHGPWQSYWLRTLALLDLGYWR